MTLSVHKATVTTDLQALGKVLPESETGLKNGAETDTAGNAFSDLFSTLTGLTKLAKQASTETIENVAKTAGSELDKAVDGELESLILAEAETSVTSDPALGGKGDATNESSEDLLARLDQSALLLQTPAPAQTQTSKQASEQTSEQMAPRSLFGDGAMRPGTSGNGLPSLAATGNLGHGQQVKIAGDNTVASADTPLTDSELAGVANFSEADSLSENNNVAESNRSSALNQWESKIVDPLAQPVQTEQFVTTTPTLAGLNFTSPESLSQQVLPAGITRAGAGSLITAMQAEAGQQSATPGLGETLSVGKNKQFGSLSAAITDNSALVSEQAEETDSADIPSTEQIELVDFSQLMDSVRKQEQPELAPRVMTKAPVLTEAEQQVLDKRVNLHNNSASSELHEKISIMAGKELQTATIRLDPAELGSLNIKLVVHNDQATVVIHAQNGQSRDLLEQQLPRLREMLQQQGITLGDTQVQADSGGQQQSHFQQSGQQSEQTTGQNNSSNSANYAVDSQTEVPVSTQYWQDSAKGVDFYA